VNLIFINPVELISKTFGKSVGEKPDLITF